MRWSTYINGAAILAAMTSGLVHAQCFTPLSDPKSRVASDWHDLVSFDLSKVQLAAGAKAYLRIADGLGDKINLDYYQISFPKPKNVTIQEFFRTLRTHFGEFAAGAAHDYDFYQYPVRDVSINALAKKYAELWASDNPNGAVMRFYLKGFKTPSIAYGAGDRNMAWFVVKSGDVQCTCATPTDFIFTTLESDAGGKHPVSGNRGFGIKESVDHATWIFYTQGADRQSSFAGNLIEDRLRKVAPDTFNKTMFDRGHEFWLFFFANLQGYLNQQGLSVSKDNFLINSARADWPL